MIIISYISGLILSEKCSVKYNVWYEDKEHRAFRYKIDTEIIK